MKRRLALLCTLSALALTASATPALAWVNGGFEGNGYGTHDWMLDNAIRVAGEQGAWVERETALLASDDPDKEASKVYHLFRDSYGSRGAAQAVAEQYAQAVEAYAAGDTQDASYHIGMLSHYYTDICQPFHSEFDALHYGTYHQMYESGIGLITREQKARTDWTAARPLQHVSDVRKKTVSAAAYSRARFPSLLASLKKYERVTTTTVQTITGEVSRRAVNDLADIIASVPSGSGVAHAPYRIKTWMYRSYPARNGKAAVYARCTDASGAPISGARVVLSFKQGTKTAKITEYSDKDGLVYWWFNTGDVPLMKKTTVTAFNETGAESQTGSTWFMATPTLAEGGRGIRATVSDGTPKQGTRVTVKAKVRDSKGRPVVGLPVTFYWKHASKTIKLTAVTNSYGNAKCTRDLGKARAGYRVYVRAQTQSGGLNRSSTTSFVPHR